ncbi:hypothetical protein EVA_11610, partial [gut metagenome]
MDIGGSPITNFQDVGYGNISLR